MEEKKRNWSRVKQVKEELNRPLEMEAVFAAGFTRAGELIHAIIPSWYIELKRLRRQSEQVARVKSKGNKP
jgi:CelD/BcsL family acetyltransferase involved in cellulose biosynthesis